MKTREEIYYIMNNDNSWFNIEAIAAIATGMASTIAAIFKLRANKAERIKRKVKEVASSENRVQDLLNEFTYKNKECSRVNVSSAKNGGDVLSIGTPRYVNVLFESIDGLRPIKGDFQDYRATGGYMKMMREAMIDPINTVVFDSRDESIDENLRGLYKSIEVNTDICKFVTYRENPKKLSDELIFVHTHYKENLDGDELMVAKAKVNTLTEKLRRLIK